MTRYLHQDEFDSFISDVQARILKAINRKQRSAVIDMAFEEAKDGLDWTDECDIALEFNEAINDELETRRESRI